MDVEKGGNDGIEEEVRLHTLRVDGVATSIEELSGYGVDKSKRWDRDRGCMEDCRFPGLSSRCARTKFSYEFVCLVGTERLCESKAQARWIHR